MKMNVFEYTVAAKYEDIASFENLDHANAFARSIAKTMHCDVDVINAFTGEVHTSLCCQLHITYNAEMEELEKYYEVKEREW